MNPGIKVQLMFIRFLTTLVLLTSAFVQSKEINTSNISGCIKPKESMARKNQLENKIRSQVRFLGEPEAFHSITHKMSEYKIPALSLAVIQQGEIAWADIYQNRAFSKAHTLNCNSLFQAASLSKPVTVMAAVRMHSAGEIDLDNNIQNYLKNFTLPPGKQTADNPVTLRNIFSHTSGITPGGYQGYITNIALPSDIDILKGNAGTNSPAITVSTPPNETLAHSGGAYTLAEVVLQDIFQNEFASIMKKWILDPAEMKHSDFTQPLPAAKHKLVAKGYTHAGTVLAGGWRNHPEQAAAGLWSNSIDMAKFLVEIYKGYQGKSIIFSRSDIQALINHERDGHIYGFIVNHSGDDISITHYGGNAGYNTGMTISLTTGNGLAYLTNSENGWKLGRDLLLSASHTYNWNAFKQTVVQKKQVTSDVLQTLQGKYKWNDQDDFRVLYDKKGNFISLLFPGGTEYKLTPIVSGKFEFIHQYTGERIIFAKQDGIQTFHLYGGVATKKDQ